MCWSREVGPCWQDAPRPHFSISQPCVGRNAAGGSWLQFPPSNEAFPDCWGRGKGRKPLTARTTVGRARAGKAGAVLPAMAEPWLWCRRVRGAWVGAHGGHLSAAVRLRGVQGRALHWCLWGVCISQAINPPVQLVQGRVYAPQRVQHDFGHVSRYSLQQAKHGTEVCCMARSPSSTESPRGRACTLLGHFGLKLSFRQPHSHPPRQRALPVSWRGSV